MKRCPTSKVRYKSRPLAESNAARIIRQGFGTGARAVPMYPYRCKKCEGWHLTRKPQKPEQVGRQLPRPLRRSI